MPEQVLNAQNGVNLSDPSIQVSLARYVEMGVMNVDRDLAIFKFMGPVGDLTEGGNMNNADRLRHAVNVVDFPNKQGQITIHHRKPQQRSVRWDEQAANRMNTRPTERVSFTFGPRQVSSDEGYPIGDDFYESILPVNRIPDVIEGLGRDYAALMAELMMAKFSGRMGDTERGGWQVFVGKENGHDATGEAAMGASGKRRTHPEFANLNPNEIYYQPSDYLQPDNTDFEENGTRPSPQTLTAASKMSYSFLNRVLEWCQTRENDQIRGLGFRPADVMKMQEAKGGNFTKVPDGVTKGCIIISHRVARQLREDSQWIQFQQSMATNMGAHQGWSTGDIGSISGYSLWQSHKVVQFDAGSAGTVKAHRCLMLGRGAGMFVRYKPMELPEKWDGIIRQRNWLPKNTPARAPAMRLYIDKQFSHRAIFWQSWMQANIVDWPMNYGGYEKVNNVVALDVAA